MRVSKSYPVIAWWSGGVVSAITCKLCIDWFGVENVRVIFIDAANNEHPSTYTFLKQCELWYGCKIEILKNAKYDDIKDVWYDFQSLNLAKGAICSSELKIKVRQDFCKRNNYSYQAFGYDINEMGRAEDMMNNNAHLRPIFPVISMLYDKKKCIKVIQQANDMFLKIDVPVPYELGLENNNCWKTGCVKGGIGYWQWMHDNQPEKFDDMAIVEHELTELKGEPVTICKDQSNDAKNGNQGKAELVFLKHNPKYPDMKDISMMEGRPPEKLMECSAFCSNDDLKMPI